MKNKKVIWMGLFFIMGMQCVLTISCKNEDVKVDQDKFTVLNPPNDEIPYETLGSGKIVFNRLSYGDQNLENGFYTIDIDKKATSGLRFNGVAMHPNVCPDGTKIAFSSYTNVTTAYDIYLMNFNGSTCFPLYQSPDQDFFSSWTPDGSKILVFASAVGPLYMQSPIKNATDRTELIKFYYGDDPNWLINPYGGFSISPAQKLVCVSNGGSESSGMLLIEPFKGKSGVSIFLPYADNQNFFAPAFSPDGLKIAFLTIERDSLQNCNYVCVKSIHSDGTNLTQLAKVKRYDSPVNWLGNDYICLCWSPNGTKILFTAPTEEFGCHLFVINADGSDLTQVTDNSLGYDIDISWSR
jgi:Tol biopolymer transport system component